MSDTIKSLRLPEPWLRGTLSDIPAVQRAALHALELAREDLDRWCGELTDAELSARPSGLPPVAFHLRHIARSLDRLLTYAEGRGLNQEQLAALATEMEAEAASAQLFAELGNAFNRSCERILHFDAKLMEEKRTVGKRQLPTSLGGLLVHIADHTQRHVGQAVTTAKVLLAQRQAASEECGTGSRTSK